METVVSGQSPAPHRLRRRIYILLSVYMFAYFAAQAMSDDLEQQIEMAASLMGLEPAQVRAEVLKARARPERTITAVAPRRDAPGRSVVVEYKSPRRTIRAR